jgi:uncharacterized protein
MTVSGFDWDAANIEKCKKHGLLIEEIEEVFKADPVLVSDVAHSDAEDRSIAIGKLSNGRPVFVAFTYRVDQQRTLIRPVSARYMHDKEVTRYEKAIAEIQD